MGINYDKLKEYYNYWLRRYYKGLKYLCDNSIDIVERDKWMPDFINIRDMLSVLLDLLGTYTQDEALNGFKVEKEKKQAV